MTWLRHLIAKLLGDPMLIEFPTALDFGKVTHFAVWDAKTNRNIIPLTKIDYCSHCGSPVDYDCDADGCDNCDRDCSEG